MAEDPRSASPFPTGASVNAADDPRESLDPQRLTVFLIEDNDTDVFVIQEVLKELGIGRHLHIASDGDSALKLWETVQTNPKFPCPGLVLLDLNLPKVSGLEVLMRIRNSRRCRDVPVVIVTSSSSPEDTGRARVLQASAYFQKPIDLSEYMSLGRVIQEVLRSRTL